MHELKHACALTSNLAESFSWIRAAASSGPYLFSISWSRGGNRQGPRLEGP